MFIPRTVFIIVYMVSRLIALLWKTNKGVHSWARLILSLSRVISSLWFFVQGLDPVKNSPFHINMLIYVALVLNMHPRLGETASPQASWYSVPNLKS